MDQYIGRFLDNRYEILELIGTGGMAVVYKARCHRLNRLVAVKILKDDFSREEEFRRRFHAEGEAVASLSHPNIVQVYDVSSSDNANFIVMELIDGITLKQYMAKKGTLNWKETLHFAIQIAKALEHAHGRSIVHRDIKPHNVMVLKNGSVKVTDFGIARVMSKSNTLTKEALGSVHYISPEQAKGGWVDNRSDLYSLSVVMYEMMTGRPPYDGESPVAVAIKHINGGAPEPSTLNPNIPDGLEQIIMKGMALDVKDRYTSATEMLQDMEQFRTNPSVHFAYAKSVPVDATIVLQADKVAEAVRQSRAAAEEASTPVRTPANKPVSRDTGRQMQQRSRQTSSAQRAKEAGTAEAVRRTEEGYSSLPRRKTREEIRREVRAEERNRAATIAVVACSAVAIIAILIFLVVLVNGGLVGRGENMVYVPDLEGKYIEQASGTTGIVIEIDQYVNSDEYEKGQIISHTPEYGAQVLQGTVVKVTVSLGPEPEVKTMDYLLGLQEADARAVLTSMGMIPVAMEEFSEYIEKGKVARTDPAFGAVLTEGQTVYIYISKGPLIETAEMPYLVGLDYATAKKTLEDLGFEDVDFKTKESKADRDEVIEQPFKKGEKVDLTTKVVLVISKGSGSSGGSSSSSSSSSGNSSSNSGSSSASKPKEETPSYTIDDLLQNSAQQPSYQNPSQGSGGSNTVKNKTKNVSISLPSDRTDQYLLGIYQNSKQVIEDTIVSPGMTKISVVLTGSGVQSYDLYINSQFYKTVKVDFDAND